jgi:hypothetical protein
MRKLGWGLVGVVAVMALVVAVLLARWAQLRAGGSQPCGLLTAAGVGLIDGTTNFNDLGVENLTVSKDLHVTGALWGASAITITSPSTIRLGSGDIALGDTAGAGNMTELRLSDTDQAVEIGNAETGQVFVVDIEGAAVRNLSLPFYTRRALTAKTADATVDAGETFGVLTNRGAAGAVTFTLPALGASSAGLQVCAYVAAAQALNLDPATGDKIEALTDTAGDKIANSTVGSYICLLAADATNWQPLERVGTWADAN